MLVICLDFDGGFDLKKYVYHNRFDAFKGNVNLKWKYCNVTESAKNIKFRIKTYLSSAFLGLEYELLYFQLFNLEYFQPLESIICHIILIKVCFTNF